MIKSERITLLEEFKTKDWFKLSQWEDRDLDCPSKDVIKKMGVEVRNFANFLIGHLNANTQNLKSQTEQFFKDWDTEEYNQDEVEFMVEVEYEAMRFAGLDVDELII